MQEKKFPEEGEVLIGTVDRIVGTNVFVKLEDYNKEGVLVFSEVAPGRIRNIRDYVRIGQKIVCKVLRVDEAKDHIDLSLRRVTTREKKEVLERYKKEKDFLIMMKIILKEKQRYDEIIEKINENFGLSKFLEEVMANLTRPDEIKELLKKASFTEDEAFRLIKLISEKIKEKKIRTRAEISLSSEAEDGIERIKKVLSDVEQRAKVNYMGAPTYLIIVEDTDPKEANKKLKEIIDDIGKKAKELGCHFEHKQAK